MDYLLINMKQKTKIELIFERERAAVKRNPPTPPPALRDKPLLAVEVALMDRMKKYQDKVIGTGIFENERVDFEHLDDLKELKDAIEIHSKEVKKKLLEVR